jgi:hypothetical protein
MPSEATLHSEADGGCEQLRPRARTARGRRLVLARSRSSKNYRKTVTERLSAEPHRNFNCTTREFFDMQKNVLGQATLLMQLVHT